MKSVLVIAVVGAVVGLVAIVSKQASDTRRRRFRDRERLTVDTFYARYYEGRNVPLSSVKEALWEISMATEVDEGYLRPEDRFDGALKPSRGWEYDDGLNLLESDLLKRAAKVGLSLDLPKIGTVDDYVQTFHRLRSLA